jgi:RNA polymerase sigma-70 factor (ECF subfamily)
MRDARRRLTFAEAYDRHVGDVYAFLVYRVGRRDDADDLTQVTFERALRAWGRYDPERAAPLTWLLVIARNVLIDHWRADRTAEHQPWDGEAHHEPAAPGPEQRLGPDAELEHALRQLSPRDRELVALRYGGGLTGPEIAEAMDMELNAVQQALSRALRRMRASLEGEMTR